MYKDSVPPNALASCVAYVRSSLAWSVMMGPRFTSEEMLVSEYSFVYKDLFCFCIDELIRADILRKGWYLDEDKNKVVYYEFVGAHTPDNTTILKGEGYTHDEF